MAPFFSRVDSRWPLQNGSQLRAFQGLPKLTGSMTVAIGVLVLLGWISANRLLVLVSPRFAIMNPLTASCFIPAGVALVLISVRQNGSVLARRAVLLFACILMAIGVLKLCHYLGLVSFSVDQSLLANKFWIDSEPLQTRMVPNTALCFLVCGLSLALLQASAPIAAVVAQWLALLVIGESLLALLGYLFNADSLYGFGCHLPMSAHTAAAFLLLGIGLFLVRTDCGPVALFVSPTQGGSTARRLLPFAFALPVALGALRLWAVRSQLVRPGPSDNALVVLLFLAFTVLIWWHALVLDRSDRLRQIATADLQRAHDQLAPQLQQRTAELLLANEALCSQAVQRDHLEALLTQQALEKAQLEEQLLRSQRMESIGALAGGIVHDLNNALTPMIVGSEMLARDDTPPAEREHIVKLIKDGSQRCSQMLNQILAFARGTRLEGAPANLPQLLNEMATFATNTFPKSIAVHCHVPEDLWNLQQADPTELHQLLLNLCVNARDAMPNGGDLTLSAENVASVPNSDPAAPATSPSPSPAPAATAAGPFILVRVADTGAGISADILKHIFDPFFTTKDPGKGTGLGLSIVSTIVKRHRGFIRTQSTPGHGTEMRIYLPASNVPSDCSTHLLCS